MGDFEEKLDSILNNPQAMSQIMSLAQSLSGDSQKGSVPSPAEASTPTSSNADLSLDPQLLSKMLSLLDSCNEQDDQRVALLTALRPFVKERRYARLDKAIQVAKLSRMARMALELLRSKEDPNV